MEANHWILAEIFAMIKWIPVIFDEILTHALSFSLTSLTPGLDFRNACHPSKMDTLEPHPMTLQLTCMSATLESNPPTASLNTGRYV